MWNKVIGIMGGMGPEATIDLYARITEAACARGAARDQDHPEVVISSVPRTPDRTEAIVADGPSPEPELIRSARRLEAAGAGLVVIACNAACHFLPAIRGAVGIPVLDMTEIAVRRIRERHPAVRRAGVMATDGTLRSRLYQRRLEEAGLEALVPDRENQRLLMEAVYGAEGIKAVSAGGRANEKLEAVAGHLVGAGAQLLIAGCTEIPLALRAGKLDVPLLDPAAELASAALKAAAGG